MLFTRQVAIFISRYIKAACQKTALKGWQEKWGYKGLRNGSIRCRYPRRTASYIEFKKQYITVLYDIFLAFDTVFAGLFYLLLGTVLA